MNNTQNNLSPIYPQTPQANIRSLASGVYQLHVTFIIFLLLSFPVGFCRRNQRFNFEIRVQILF